MKQFARFALFLALCWFAPPLIGKAATFVAANWGDAFATFVYAVLLAGWGFIAEFVLAKRPGWFLAAILLITAILRYALWTVASLIVIVGRVGFPGQGPNPLLEIIVTSVSFVLAFYLVNLVRYREVGKKGSEDRGE